MFIREPLGCLDRANAMGLNGYMRMEIVEAGNEKFRGRDYAIERHALPGFCDNFNSRAAMATRAQNELCGHGTEQLDHLLGHLLLRSDEYRFVGQ